MKSAARAANIRVGALRFALITRGIHSAQPLYTVNAKPFIYDGVLSQPHPACLAGMEIGCRVRTNPCAHFYIGLYFRPGVDLEVAKCIGKLTQLLPIGPVSRTRISTICRVPNRWRAYIRQIPRQ